MDTHNVPSTFDEVSTQELGKKTVFKAEELAFGSQKNATLLQESTPSIIKIRETWQEASRNGPLTNIKVDNQPLDGRIIHIESKPVLNFGSCAYLGLEFDEQLITEATSNLRKFGTQFSSSATYLMLDQYEILKEELHVIFDAPVAIAATTTLAHLSVIPAIIQPTDGIILDQLVHNSVQLATKTVQDKALIIKTIPHSNLVALEAQILKMRETCTRIWYFLDGVYSMYGDFAPIKDIEALMERYPQLHLYIDDAHGMGWIGKNGCGFAWSSLVNKDRVIVSASLSKSFSGGGGVIVCKSDLMLKDISSFGPTMIFSGPLHPVLLGMTIASAKLHQSNKVRDAQYDLKQKINFRNTLLQMYKIPVAAHSESPICFVKIGNHVLTGDLFNQLKAQGVYVNPAMFPAIANSRSGIRFTINNHHTLQDIEKLIHTISTHLLTLGVIGE